MPALQAASEAAAKHNFEIQRLGNERAKIQVGCSWGVS